MIPGHEEEESLNCPVSPPEPMLGFGVSQIFLRTSLTQGERL